MKKNRKKQKGFSLVELLAAFAISAVVMLMTTQVLLNVYNNYNTNTAKAKIQNEISATMNKLGDTILEAKAINLSGNTLLKTSVVDGDHYVDLVGKTVTYDATKKSLYVTHQIELPSNPRPYLVSKNMTEFSLSIDDSCKDYDELTGDFIGYKNPIKINVSMKVEYWKEKVSYTQSFYVRDDLTEVTVDGTVYTVK